MQRRTGKDGVPARFGVLSKVGTWSGCVAASLVGLAGIVLVVSMIIKYGRQLSEMPPLEVLLLRSAAGLEIVPPDEITPAVRAAFLAAMEPRFFENKETFWKAAWKAFTANIRAGRIVSENRIASGLARLIGHGLKPLQQLGLQVVLHDYAPREAVLAWYLNRIPLGRNIRGIAAGACAFFGKSMSQLTVTEAAWLAAVAYIPLTAWSPETQQAAIDERNRVLMELFSSGWLSAEEAEGASNDLPSTPDEVHSTLGSAK